MTAYSGTDWTDIAARLGYTGNDDEDAHKWITDKLHLPEAEDAIRNHLMAMVNSHDDNTLGHEQLVWDALMQIPYGEPAFVRMAYPLIRFMWV